MNKLIKNNSSVNTLQFTDNFNRTNEIPLSTNGWNTHTWESSTSGYSAYYIHQIDSNQFYTGFYCYNNAVNYRATSLNTNLLSRSFGFISGSFKIIPYATSTGGTGNVYIGLIIGGDTSTETQGVKLLLDVSSGDHYIQLRQNATTLVNQKIFKLSNSVQYNFDYEITHLATKIWVYQTGTGKPETPTYTYTGDIASGVTLNNKLCGIYSTIANNANYSTVNDYIDDFTILLL